MVVLVVLVVLVLVAKGRVLVAVVVLAVVVLAVVVLVARAGPGTSHNTLYVNSRLSLANARRSLADWFLEALAWRNRQASQRGERVTV